MRIQRDTTHTLALAALILATFCWQERWFDRIDATLDDIRAIQSEQAKR